MTNPSIPELDARGLRSFGLVTGSIIAVLFGAVLPWVFSLDYPRWPWILGGVLGAWALIHAPSLKPVYHLWMRFGLLLHKITTPLILGIVFYLLVTPMSLAMKVFGRDALGRKLDESVSTYRVLPDGSPKNNMEKPY